MMKITIFEKQINKKLKVFVDVYLVQEQRGEKIVVEYYYKRLKRGIFSKESKWKMSGWDDFIISKEYSINKTIKEIVEETIDYLKYENFIDFKLKNNHKLYEIKELFENKIKNEAI